MFHAIVFLGFASTAVAGTHQELLQLWKGVSRPFSAGTPAMPLACAAGLSAFLLTLVMLAYALRGRSVPLGVSAAMLLSFGGSFIALTHEPSQRSVPGANVKVLEQARALHDQVNGELQKTGRLPVSGAPLQLSGQTPFRRGFGAPLLWRVEKVNKLDELPAGAEPGWLLLQPSADLSSFAISSVGIDEHGAPAVLRQDGKTIEYRGAYNPDAPR